MIWLLFYTTSYLDLVRARIDTVFVHYFDRSLKEATQIRSKWNKIKISELSEIPKNFESFLHISQNKNDLNEYLAENLLQCIMKTRY